MIKWVSLKVQCLRDCQISISGWFRWKWWSAGKSETQYCNTFEKRQSWCILRTEQELGLKSPAPLTSFIHCTWDMKLFTSTISFSNSEIKNVASRIVWLIWSSEFVVKSQHWRGFRGPWRRPSARLLRKHFPRFFSNLDQAHFKAKGALSPAQS